MQQGDLRWLVCITGRKHFRGIPRESCLASLGILARTGGRQEPRRLSLLETFSHAHALLDLISQRIVELRRL
jgi:hypothetical protein